MNKKWGMRQEKGSKTSIEFVKFLSVPFSIHLFLIYFLLCYVGAFVDAVDIFFLSAILVPFEDKVSLIWLYGSNQQQWSERWRKIKGHKQV